jgi:hypothetical protein
MSQNPFLKKALIKKLPFKEGSESRGIIMEAI